MEKPAWLECPVPALIRDQDQWIVWRIEEKNGTPTKVPVNRAGRIDANDAANWLSLAAARELALEIGAEGIGFVLTEECGITVVDLDGCRTKKSIAPWASDILSRFDTYIEMSPSGTGFKIFAAGKVSLPNGKGSIKAEPDVPRLTKEKSPGLEVFTHGRFVAFTGLRVADKPEAICDVTKAVEELLTQYFPVPKKATKKKGKLPTAAEMARIIRNHTYLVTVEYDGREYVRCSSQFPCPRCGADSWCYVAVDGRHLFCSRAKPDEGRLTDGGNHVCIRLAGGENGPKAPKKLCSVKWRELVANLRAEPVSSRWADIAAEASQQLTSEHKTALAQTLGVAETAVCQLGAGWSDDQVAWMLPEKDGQGNIIGITRRFQPPQWRDGKMVSQKAMNGSKRGVYYESGWLNHHGPVLIPEGFSDTAAAITLGYSAIGRPSAKGGVKYLTQLLSEVPADRDIIVLAENDEKPDGRHPGREGAEFVAERLADALQRSIAIAFPGRHKDLRKFLNSFTKGKLTSAKLLVCRLQLMTHLNSTREEVEPIRHYSLPAPQPAVPLNKWRSAQVKARLASLNKPGIYLDRSAPGTGKSYADGVAIERAVAEGKRCVVVVPTHENCREVVQDLGSRGIEAVAFPELDRKACQYHKAATTHVNEFGLNIASTLCPSCSLRRNCSYRVGVSLAHAASVAVATTKRAEMDDRLFRGREYIAIHEQCDDVFVQQFTLRPEELAEHADALELIAKQVGHVCSLLDEKVEDASKWLKRMAVWVRKLSRQHGDPESTDDRTWRLTTKSLEALKPPKGSLRYVGRVLSWWKQNSSRPKNYSSKVMRGLLAICRRQASWRTMQMDSDDGALTQLVIQHRRKLPGKATIWIGDGTADKNRLERLAKRPIIDRTPRAAIPYQQAVQVIPSDITQGKSAEAVAAHLRAVLLYHQPQRLGVIGHQEHMKSIFSDDGGLLSPELRERVHLWTYFGQGLDRASNQWLECDLLLVLGTPRLPEQALRDKLIQQGLYPDAAVTPTWSEFTFDVNDSSGQIGTVLSKAHQESAWHDEGLYQTTSALLQAIGRGRSILPEGIPVIVFSNTRLQQFAYHDEHPVDLVTPVIVEVIEAVTRISKSCGSARSSEVAAELGKQRSNVSAALKRASELGYLENPSRGKYCPIVRAAGVIQGPVEVMFSLSSAIRKNITSEPTTVPASNRRVG